MEKSLRGWVHAFRVVAIVGAWGSGTSGNRTRKTLLGMIPTWVFVAGSNFMLEVYSWICQGKDVSLCPSG